MQFQSVLLYIALVSVGARVIQNGEEDASCYPEDFETYRWVLAGNTWFAETRGKKSNVVVECEEIEPGRTSLGGPRNSLEATRLNEHFRDPYYYINVAQIGYKWYRYIKMSEKPVKLESMTWTDWQTSQPGSAPESCAILWLDKKWYNAKCFGKGFRGVCELRCDSL